MTQRVPYLPALLTSGDLVMLMGVGFVKTIIGMKVWCWGWYNNKKKIYRQYISVVVSSHFFLLEYGKENGYSLFSIKSEIKSGHCLSDKPNTFVVFIVIIYFFLVLGDQGDSYRDGVKKRRKRMLCPTRLTRGVLEFWIRLKGILHRSVLRTQWKWEPYHPIACVFLCCCCRCTC